MVSLFVNDQKEQLEAPMSLLNYLKIRQIPYEKGVAIAINNEVIPKSKWANQQLKENDNLTIITATAGG